MAAFASVKMPMNLLIHRESSFIFSFQASLIKFCNASRVRTRSTICFRRKLPVVALVAQTSDWVDYGESNPRFEEVTDEEEEHDDEGDADVWGLECETENEVDGVESNDGGFTVSGELEKSTTDGQRHDRGELPFREGRGVGYDEDLLLRGESDEEEDEDLILAEEDDEASMLSLQEGENFTDEESPVSKKVMNAAELERIVQEKAEDEHSEASVLPSQMDNVAWKEIADGRELLREIKGNEEGRDAVHGEESPVSVRHGEPNPKNVSTEFQRSAVDRATDFEAKEDGRARDTTSMGLFDAQKGRYEKDVVDKKLFVANMPYDVDNQTLADMFREAGTVEFAEVIYNPRTDYSRGFGFVTMSTATEADKAIHMFHRFNVRGRLLTVRKAVPKEAYLKTSLHLHPTRVFVGNLSPDMDSTRLSDIFSKYGRVIHAKIVYDSVTGRCRGFGFVTMSSEAEMADVIAALNGQSLDGRIIRVAVAVNRGKEVF